MIDIDKLRESEGYMLAIVNTQTGQYKPASEDVITVIRCKYCKYYDGYFCHNKWWGDGYGNYTPPIKAEDGYCDWAERKTQNETD